jgi:hypothetical protein
LRVSWLEGRDSNPDNAERGEDLPNIDGHSTRRLDLAIRVVAFVARFGAHSAPVDHAGLSRC